MNTENPSIEERLATLQKERDHFFKQASFFMKANDTMREQLRQNGKCDSGQTCVVLTEKEIKAIDYALLHICCLTHPVCEMHTETLCLLMERIR
jgi:hypothetical protein